MPAYIIVDTAIENADEYEKYKALAKPIAEKYALNLDMVSNSVDPTFRFMCVDKDGQIRMDPSSPYAMQRLIGLKDRFDIAFACDTDHDRHSIVTKSTSFT